jgi:hypothetical protein
MRNHNGLVTSQYVGLIYCRITSVVTDEVAAAGRKFGKMRASGTEILDVGQQKQIGRGHILSQAHIDLHYTVSYS